MAFIEISINESRKSAFPSISGVIVVENSTEETFPAFHIHLENLVCGLKYGVHVHTGEFADGGADYNLGVLVPGNYRIRFTSEAVNFFYEADLTLNQGTSIFFDIGIHVPQKSPASTVCIRPPKGWFCARQPGHDGPCAAYPEAAPVVFLNSGECAILSKLLKGYVVGPTAREVLEKLEAAA